MTCPEKITTFYDLFPIPLPMNLNPNHTLLGPVNTYTDIFENGSLLLSFSKNPRPHVTFSNHFCLSTRIRIFLKWRFFSPFSKWKKYASTRSVFKSFLPVYDISRHRFPKPPFSSVHTTPKNTRWKNLETVFIKLQFWLPKTLFAWGWKPHPGQKWSAVKNIRIRVDGALVIDIQWMEIKYKTPPLSYPSLPKYIQIEINNFRETRYTSNCFVSYLCMMGSPVLTKSHPWCTWLLRILSS